MSESAAVVINIFRALMNFRVSVLTEKLL
jgi:hypothetical protein